MVSAGALVTAAAAAASASLLLISIASPAAAFLPPTPTLAGAGGGHHSLASAAPRAAATSNARLSIMMSSPAESLFNRFRRGSSSSSSRDTLSRKEERPTAKGGAAGVKLPPASTGGGGGSSNTAKAAEELKDAALAAGQQLSRFTAAVLDEQQSKSGSGVGGSTVSGSGSSRSSAAAVALKGLPADFMTKPLGSDEATVRGASAVVGGVIGLALGGPLLALVGAAWTSYSCTVPNTDAGEAARGTGKWAIGFYNFFAKMNKKYTLVQKLSSSIGGFYTRFKKEVAPDAALLDKAESSLQTAVDFTAKVSDEFNLPGLMGSALVKTGELSVAAVKALVKYNEEKKVTDKLAAWLKKELLKDDKK